jgi:hypothetical protein
MANSKLLVLVNSSNSRYYYALRGLKALAHECIEQVVFLRRKKNRASRFQRDAGK